MMIDWYPGHMKKARQQIIELLPRIDLFIEVLDARLPASSANPLLQKLRRNKPCIKVLNKKDLADPQVTREWVSVFERDAGVRALPLEAKQRAEVASILKACRTLVPGKGKPGRSLRVMVVGIPNVGKSTLINTLAGKKIARVGDKPAITTCPQQIDLRNGILLSDTPGLLWPNLDSPLIAQRLAASGAISDNALDQVAIAQFALTYLLERYPEALSQRYGFTQTPEGADDALAAIGRKRGCLLSGGDIDLHRSAEILLRELRSGLLGRVSLETPSDQSAEQKQSAEEEGL